MKTSQLFPNLPAQWASPSPSLLYHGDPLQDLLTSLQAALSGNLERIVVALLRPAAHFDAQELRTALKVPGEEARWVIGKRGQC